MQIGKAGKLQFQQQATWPISFCSCPIFVLFSLFIFLFPFAEVRFDRSGFRSFLLFSD